MIVFLGIGAMLLFVYASCSGLLCLFRKAHKPILRPIYSFPLFGVVFGLFLYLGSTTKTYESRYVSAKMAKVFNGVASDEVKKRLPHLSEVSIDIESLKNDRYPIFKDSKPTGGWISKNSLYRDNTIALEKKLSILRANREKREKGRKLAEAERIDQTKRLFKLYVSTGVIRKQVPSERSVFIRSSKWNRMSIVDKEVFAQTSGHYFSILQGDDTERVSVHSFETGKEIGRYTRTGKLRVY